MENNPTSIAERVVNSYNPERISPFPFDRIQQSRSDLKIYQSAIMPDQNISGMIVFKQEQNKFEIIINKNKPETRQYFATAHELGHYFLHQGIIRREEMIIDKDEPMTKETALYLLDNSELSEIETEANEFAEVLLMPKDSVLKAWNSLKSVEECAKIFRVSIVAMSVRLKKLDLII
ncbi:MAG: ImmA/IrrE family metallo-endopeptidase [bacterium]